jgi:hypothetical protein
MRSSKQRARPLAENLVRDAGVCQGQQDRLLQHPGTRRSASTTANEGGLWPVAFALKKIDRRRPGQIGALVKKAVFED